MNVLGFSQLIVDAPEMDRVLHQKNCRFAGGCEPAQDLRISKARPLERRNPDVSQWFSSMHSIGNGQRRELDSIRNLLWVALARPYARKPNFLGATDAA